MIASATMENKKRLICIIGPTASGKSSLAIRLAKEQNGEVISVDSRQVYKTLDIGTEKISTEQMQGIPHYLIDIQDPNDPYSAGMFVEDATRCIEELFARGKTPILAGGTHFYFDALLNGLPKTTEANRELRERLETHTPEELYAEIVRRDPRRAKELDPHNKRRLIRTLEIIEAHGSVPPRTTTPHAYQIEWHVLLPEREELREKIRARLVEALNRGLIEEVRSVREAVGDTRLNELGLEYKIVGEYLRGERSKDSLLEALSAKLFQYARRQEAWIRKLTA